MQLLYATWSFLMISNILKKVCANFLPPDLQKSLKLRMVSNFDPHFLSFRFFPPPPTFFSSFFLFECLRGKQSGGAAAPSHPLFTYVEDINSFKDLLLKEMFIDHKCEIREILPLFNINWFIYILAKVLKGLYLLFTALFIV